jgi:micrococcal nuclease
MTGTRRLAKLRRSRACFAALLGVVILVAACDNERDDRESRVSSPSPGATVSATPTRAPSGATPSRTASNAPTRTAESGRVVRIVDGDTIIVELGGRQERVRYIGVDTPETVAPDRPPECFGKEASAANARLVEGERVRLERDVSDRDQFGRLLRYVYVEDRLINAELIRDGYATAVTFPPDVSEASRLRDLEREARSARRGLWGACR